MEIGVRYCGGCNPTYDRSGFIKTLERDFPEASFVPAQEGVNYPAVLVVCGCCRRCTNISDLAVSADKLIWLTGWEDMQRAHEMLEKLTEKPSVQSLDHEAVLNLLPHRFPMLLVDYVRELVPGREAVAIGRISPQMPALIGHFPGEPMLPGVFALEAGAQTSALLLLVSRNTKGGLPLLTGVRNASFRAKILPGDEIEIHSELLDQRVELGYAIFACKVFSGGRLAARMELSLTMG